VSRAAKFTGEVEAYTYDSQNRLVANTSPTTTATYAYDALDRRIAKTVDGVTEAFIYDPWSATSTTANDAVLDFTGGTLTRRWLHGPQTDEPLAYELYTSTTTPGTGTARDLHADRLGNILRVVDPATGTVAVGYDYDSFCTRTQTGALDQRYGFTGREHDAESGLIYFRARHYDAGTGTFLQRDPIGFASGDLNLYAYVWNDPLNYKDPSGLATVDNTNLSARVLGMSLGLGIVACAASTDCVDVAGSAVSAFSDAANEAGGGINAAIAAAANSIRAALDWIISESNGRRKNDGGGPGPGPGDSGPELEGASSGINGPSWAGIPGVLPHPDGPASGGRKQQGIKEGGREQAEEDFEAATGGVYGEIGEGRLRGTGPNGENIIFNPQSTGGSGRLDGGIPTIYVDGGEIRYP
jgi:RHS repeat-associated protein